MSSISFLPLLDFLDDEHLHMMQEKLSRYCFNLCKNEKPTENQFKLISEIRIMSNKQTADFLDELFDNALNSASCLQEAAKLIANIPVSKNKKAKNNTEFSSTLNTINEVVNSISPSCDLLSKNILALEDLTELVLYASNQEGKKTLKTSVNDSVLNSLISRIGPKKYFKGLEEGAIQKVAQNDNVKKVFNVAEKVIGDKNIKNGLVIEGVKQIGIAAKDKSDNSIKEAELRLFSVTLTYIFYYRILQSRDSIFTGVNHA